MLRLNAAMDLSAARGRYGHASVSSQHFKRDKKKQISNLKPRDRSGSKHLLPKVFARCKADHNDENANANCTHTHTFHSLEGDDLIRLVGLEVALQKSGNNAVRELNA